MLALRLQPGSGLGGFVLGQSLAEVCRTLRQQRHQFRCVEVNYAEEAGQDIMLNLPEHGFHLRFDSASQRLRLIEVHDVTRLQLQCGKAVFGGASNPPTFGGLYQVLGPTSSFSAADEGTGLVPLHYPGVLFLFPPAPTSTSLGGVAPTAGNGKAELCVPLNTVAARICIYAGAASSVCAALAALPPAARLSSGSLGSGGSGSGSGSIVEAVPCQGLWLRSGQVVRFGDSLQDVLAELGPPSGTQPASSSAAASHAGSSAGSYWLCYAERGIAVLMEGGAHRVHKLLLHANLPGHLDFSLMQKCHFRVHAPGSWSLPGDGSAADLLRLAGEYSDGAASMKTAASGSVQGSDSPRERTVSTAAGDSGPAVAPGSATAAHSSPVHAAAKPIAVETPLQLAASKQEQSAGESGGELQLPVDRGALLPSGKPPLPPRSAPVAMATNGIAAAAAAAALGSSPLTSSTGKPLTKKQLKKRGKKLRQQQLVLEHEGGGVDADTEGGSVTDSGPSSLASSPGLTSHLTSHRLGGYSGYSSEGSALDLAAREQRLDGGSAYDGWSDADDLAGLLDGSPSNEPALATAAPPAAAAAAAAAHADADTEAAQHAPPSMKVCAAVQTLPPSADDEAAAAEAYQLVDGAEADFSSGGSPSRGFIIPETPTLFDDSAVSQEYESLPRQRSSGTQTQRHLLAPPQPTYAGHAGGAMAAAAAAAAAGRAVSVDDSLAEIEAVFGANVGPALHNRLAGGPHGRGPTYLYAYRGLVFEVTESGQLATVTMFKC